jgi:uncharacterized protein YbaR (Trm112 family)
MRRLIMDIVCCPVCKGVLTLEVQQEDEKEILEGGLFCPVCGVNYPIHEGTPNLLPQTPQTK